MTTLPSHEHRSVPRRSGETLGPLKLFAEAVGESLSANVQDISILGIGLVADCSLASGTSLTVQSGPSGRGLESALTAQVRHATKRDDGRWLVGCRFSRHLTTTDMDVLG